MSNAKVTVSQLSLERFCVLSEFDDGSTAFGEYEFPTIPESEIAKKVVVESNDRLEDVARRELGSPELWPVIAVLNQIDFVPTGLVPNQTLLIPSKKWVNEVWLRTNR